MKEIDLNEWKLFSSRKNSDNYVSKDGRFLLKVLSGERRSDIDKIINEKRISDLAISNGISTPEVFDIARINNDTYGIIYQYVRNKESYARYISEHPENAETMMKEWAHEARILHSTLADTSSVPSFISLLKNSLNNSHIYSEEEKAVILSAAEVLPKAATCLHGDFQQSNILKGDEKSFWIDLEMMSYGHPFYDIGFLWFVSEKISDELCRKVFHTDIDTYKEWCRIFALEYFNNEDIGSIISRVRPYGYVSCNLMLTSMPDSGFINYNKEEIVNACRTSSCLLQL